MFLWSGCRTHFKTRPHTKRKLRNCLLITIDTLRADHLGCYGYGNIESPVIDNLADEGVLFQQAFTPVPITLPSHASIMTGLYPAVHGVKDNGIYRLEDSFLTLAEIFRAQGYLCAAFVVSFVLNSRFGLSQGFDSYNDHMTSSDLKSTSLYQERKAEMVTNDVLDFFDHQVPEPFFVWVHYFGPHIPYDPPDPFLRDYKDSPYDGEIAYTDFCIGKILKCLEKKNQIDDTLIIITSDHGEGLGEHGERTHGIFIYDTTLHIPMIMKCPEILPGGKKIRQQVRTIDLFPSILDLLGLKSIKADCNGKSIIPYIFGGQSKGNILYCSTDYPYLGFGWAPLEGIRIDEWKYIKAPKSELYQIKKNPGETENLVYTQPKKAASLSAKLKDIKKRFSDHARQINPIPLDPRTQQRLLSLGYVSPGVQNPDIKTVNPESLPDPKDKVSIVTDIDIGMSQYLKGDLDAAAKRLKSVLLEDPDNLLGNFLLGSVCQEREDFAKALRAFSNVSDINPDYLDIHHHLGEIYLDMGKQQEALHEFLRATELDLGRAEALNAIGEIYFDQGKFSKAIKTLKNAIALDPDSPELHFNLGTTLEQNGDLEEAIREYQNATDLQRKNARAWNKLGHLYMVTGRLSGSVSAIQTAISVDPNQADFYNNLGLTYKKMGMTKTSIKQFNQAIRLDPDMMAPWYNLAIIKF